jgi:hypothetical protein
VRYVERELQEEKLGVVTGGMKKMRISRARQMNVGADMGEHNTADPFIFE